MLRLAVFDFPTSLFDEVIPRIRGAILHVGDEAAIDQCDAIVCNASRLDATQIESLRQNNKHLFLLVDQVSDALVAGPFFSDPRIRLVNPEHYLPQHQLIRQQLDAGKLGEPGLLRLHRWEPAPLRLRDIELAFWFFDRWPNVVYAVENAWCTQIHLGFRTGGMALLDYGTHLPKGDTYYHVSLIGAHGAVYADDHANIQLVYQGDSPRAVRSNEIIAQWTSMLQSFISECGSDQNPNAADRDYTWRGVLAVNAAVETSLRTKQTVAIKGA